MSSEKKSGILVVVFIVLTIVSAGGGYLYQSASLNPVIETLEQENAKRLDIIQMLNASIQMSSAMNAIQNATISRLETEKAAYDEQINNITQQISILLEELEETEQDLDFYKTVSKRFYETNPIRIGVTCARSEDERYIEDLIEKAEIDIHGYCAEQDLPYRFDFIVGNNLGSDEIALSNMINYYALGINLVVGHGWNSQCSVSLNYADNNDMILLSPSSSSALLAYKDDNLFRLTVNDTLQLDANIECMKQMGIKSVLVFSVNTDWGEFMSQTFTQKLTQNGIEVFKVVYYTDQTQVSINSQLFYLSGLLDNATSEYGNEHVALQIFGNDRIDDLLGSYFPLADVIWFGTEANAQTAFGRPSPEALSVLILSPVPVTKSPNFSKFNMELRHNYGFNVTFYGGNIYDACWLYALSIIRTCSTSTQAIKEVLPTVSSEYQGVTGDCSLNAYGDRNTIDYNIMGYSYTDNDFVVYGYYNSTQNTVEFYRIHQKIP